MSKKGVVAIAGVLTIAGLSVAAAINSKMPATKGVGSRASVRAEPPARGSLAARFTYLSRQNSNRCTLDGTAVMQMPSGARLQGSCCVLMDRPAYDDQIRKLRGYADVRFVPRDPYDISVGLAKELLGYESIRLAPAQQRIYDRAKPLSSTGGPCCCQCWRAEAFDGQAKYLITRRSYSSHEIAAVWSAEEGCGGPES